MSDSQKKRVNVLTEEEIHALVQPLQAIRLSTYGEALSIKTPAFKFYLFTGSFLATAYLVIYFLGGLDTYLAYGWSKLRVDYNLHQIRFMAGFFMLVLLHVWILLQQRLETLLWNFIALQTYFQFSGTAHLIKLDGAINDILFMSIYISIQSVFIVLLYLMIREERVSQIKIW